MNAGAPIPLIPRFLPWRPQVNLDPTAFLGDPELIQALEQQSAPILCEQDRILFRQGDSPSGLYILHKGEATLTMRTWAGESVISSPNHRRLHPRLTRPYRQRTLYPHGRSPQWRPNHLRLPRQLRSPHAIQPHAAPENPARTGGRSSLRPQRHASPLRSAAYPLFADSLFPCSLN